MHLVAKIGHDTADHGPLFVNRFDKTWQHSATRNILRDILSRLCQAASLLASLVTAIEDLREVVITEEVVQGEGEPEYISDVELQVPS